MRLATLLALLVLAAPALRAQCAPDPVPADAYYPLGVGDEWIYHLPADDDTPEAYVRRQILRTDAAFGNLYAVEQTCQTAIETGVTTCDPDRLVRINEETAVVAVTSPSGDEAEVLSRLDAPLGSSPTGMCATDLGTSVVIGGTAYTVPRVKALPALDFGPPPVAAGIGQIGLQVGSIARYTDRFEYARIGGTEYGSRPTANSDPTPARDYYPLEVGTERIYFEFTVLFHGYERERVVREETVGGVTYSVEAFDTYDLRSASPAWTTVGERLVRYDPATTNLISVLDGAEYVLFCNLGADFGAEVTCGGNTEAGYLDYGQGPVRIGGTDYVVAQLKGINTIADPPPPPLAAGIGPLEPSLFGEVGEYRFEYANVRGVEYGVRPVAGEAEAPTAETLAITATPNPTAGALSLSLTLTAAQTVRIEAFDALGRRVYVSEAPLAAGTQRVAVDASMWAPGVYVVRATAGAEARTARVVRQ